MVKRTATNSVLTGRMKDRVNKVKDKDIPIDAGGRIPAGIDNGVAKLVDIKIGKFEKGDNKGKPYFMVRGVVVEPKKHERITVEGLQESFVMEPLHETAGRKRASEDDHVDYMVGVLKSLGVDSDNLDPDEIDDGSLFASMLEEDLYFKFRSWKGEATEQYPNPRTNYTFGGGCEYQNGEVVDEVQDDTGDEPNEEDEPDEEESDAQPEEQEEDVAVPSGKELTMLGIKADKGDAAACEKLNEYALQVGIDQDTIDDAAKWKDLVALIVEAGQNQPDETEEDEDEDEDEDDEESEEDEDEAVTPQKGDVWFYKPPKAKKSIECEVTASFEGKKTCNLKSLSDGKVFKSIPWDEMSMEAS